MRWLAGLGGLALVGAAAALSLALDKGSVRAGTYEVPAEVPAAVARPAGPGPHPPVLYIHARRGFEVEDRAPMRNLAARGFLVLAPDRQAGSMIERWPGGPLTSGATPRPRSRPRPAMHVCARSSGSRPS